MKSVLVLAAGNEMRGDDGAGPHLIAYLERPENAHVRTLFEFQFQVEHAVDLAEADLALFIDAHASQERPLVFEEMLEPAMPVPSTHALSPAEVVGVARQLGLTVPPVFVLAVAGRCFDLGAPMSPEGVAACARAESLLDTLMARPDAAIWREVATRADRERM